MNDIISKTRASNATNSISTRFFCMRLGRTGRPTLTFTTTPTTRPISRPPQPTMTARRACFPGGTTRISTAACIPPIRTSRCRLFRWGRSIINCPNDGQQRVQRQRADIHWPALSRSVPRQCAWPGYYRLDRFRHPLQAESVRVRQALAP